MDTLFQNSLDSHATSRDAHNEFDTQSGQESKPLLDTVRVASPCNEPWDKMVGDGRTRFCGKCEKNVHNISEMTRDEAEAFLQSLNGTACLRMYQRADGTVMTADCPVGAKKKRVKKLFLSMVGGGLAAGAVAFWGYVETAGQRLGDLPALDRVSAIKSAASNKGPDRPSYDGFPVGSTRKVGANDSRQHTQPIDEGAVVMGVAPMPRR